MEYPPGVSAGSPKAPWNEAHAHEHEFLPAETDVIIEDGAAVFQMDCQYAEGEYGQGYQCEASKQYRFEYSTLESPNGETAELSTIAECPGQFPDEIRSKIISIEDAFHTYGPGDTVGFSVNPDPDCGYVTIEYGGWKLHFRP